MSVEAATPETGTVDAPVSMDSIIAEIAGGEGKPVDSADEVAKEIAADVDKEVNTETEAGDTEEVAGHEEGATEAEDEAEAPTEEPKTDDKPEPAYKVTVDGKEVEVPLSELVKGYSRERDYTAKTMALGEEKRNFEAERSTAIQQLQTQYATELQNQVAVFEQSDPVLAQANQFTEAQWAEMKRTDPAQFVEWQDAVQSRLNAIANAKAQVQQIATQQTEAQRAAQQQAMSQQSEMAAAALVETMPELADPAKFEGFITQTFDYLKESGLKGDELRDLVHPVALTIADKARRFDELERAKAGLPAKRVVPTSAVTPLRSDASNSTRAPTARFPANKSATDRADWVARQILNSE